MEALRRCFIILLVLLSGTAYADADIQIKDIKISGLEYSRARVVLRELPFSEGDVWRTEFAGIGARRLKNLGLFSEAVIAPPNKHGVVHITVNDRWPHWVLPEASRSDNGASSAGLTLTEHNLWGLHHNLRVAAKRDTGKDFSGNNGNSYQGSYQWRRVKDSNYGLDMSINSGESNFDAYDNGVISSSYFLKQTGWSAGVSYGFGPVPGEGWDARLGFSSNDRAYTIRSGPILPDIQDLHRQAIQLSASHSMVSNQITWLTGSRFNYAVTIAHQSLGSDINSYRQTIGWSRYLDFGDQNTLNFRLKGGWLAGDILRDGLFDLGSRDEIRGYFPGELQGNIYAYGTVEGRYLIEPGSNVQLVAFVDAGHVRNQGQQALDTPIVAGAGVGVRWTLRWLVDGTLRADVAYGSATKKWRAYIGTGQAF
jgi:outer membrane protein assembly factor BamA